MRGLTSNASHSPCSREAVPTPLHCSVACAQHRCRKCARKALDDAASRLNLASCPLGIIRCPLCPASVCASRALARVLWLPADPRSSSTCADLKSSMQRSRKGYSDAHSGESGRAGGETNGSEFGISRRGAWAEAASGGTVPRTSTRRPRRPRPELWRQRRRPGCRARRGARA